MNARNKSSAPTPVINPFAERRAVGRDAMNQAATSTGTINNRPMKDTTLSAPANPTTAQAQNQPLLAAYRRDAVEGATNLNLDPRLR